MASPSRCIMETFNEEEVKAKVIAVLEQIYDPEIPVNIYALGLIYKIEFSVVEEKLTCYIEMTLTSAACPVAESLVEQVYNVQYIVDEIDGMSVDIVFDPPWSPDNIPYEAKLELGLL